MRACLTFSFFLLFFCPFFPPVLLHLLLLLRFHDDSRLPQTHSLLPAPFLYSRLLAGLFFCVCVTVRSSDNHRAIDHFFQQSFKRKGGEREASKLSGRLLNGGRDLLKRESLVYTVIYANQRGCQMKAQIFSRTRHQRSVGLWQQISVRLLNNRMRDKEELARYRAFTLVVLSSDWFDAVVTRKMNLHLIEAPRPLFYFSDF